MMKEGKIKEERERKEERWNLTKGKEARMEEKGN